MRTWDRAGVVVCVLVIFSHLLLFSPTDPGWGGWASGKGGWFCTSGSQASRKQGGRVETKGAQTGGMSPSMSPVGGARIVAPFCICCAQGEMEKSRRKNLGEEERHCSNSSH